MTPVEAIVEARALLTPDRWVKYAPVTRNTVCLVTAIGAAHQGKRTPRYLDLVVAVSDAVVEMFPHRVEGAGGNVASKFNDHPETTLEDVWAVLDRAEERLSANPVV